MKVDRYIELYVGSHTKKHIGYVFGQRSAMGGSYCTPRPLVSPATRIVDFYLSDQGYKRANSRRELISQIKDRWPNARKLTPTEEKGISVSSKYEHFYLDTVEV